MTAYGQGGKLHVAPAAWAALGAAAGKVSPKQPGDNGRMARVVMKAGTVMIKLAQPIASREMD